MGESFQARILLLVEKSSEVLEELRGGGLCGGVEAPERLFSRPFVDATAAAMAPRWSIGFAVGLGGNGRRVDDAPDSTSMASESVDNSCFEASKSLPSFFSASR